MDTSQPLTGVASLKRLSEGNNSEVTVGLLIVIDAEPQVPHFFEDELSHPASLDMASQYSAQQPSPPLFHLACGLAAVNGIEHFRRLFQRKFDYKVTILNGRNLSEDCTVGFCVAAFKAACLATGFEPSVEQDMCGWGEA